MAECAVTELAEGTIEVRLKINGILYALGLRLEEFPTEDALRKGLRTVNLCLRETLFEQGYWLRDAK